MSGRYGVYPGRLKGQPDIVEYIKDINGRLKTGEVGLRIGNTAIDSGNLTVKGGTIRIENSEGEKSIAIAPGDTPIIAFYPGGESDPATAVMFSFVTPEDLAVVELSSGRNDGGFFVQDGGKVLLWDDSAILSHQPDGGEESLIWLNVDPNLSEAIFVRGRFGDSAQYDSRQAFYTGRLEASSGFSTWTHTYPTTWDDQILPIITVHLNGSTVQWGLDDYTVSGFTVRFSSTASIKVVNFFNVRCT